MNLTPASEVAALVLSRLRLRQPCSVIRLGDGEGRMLAWPRIDTTAFNRHLRF